MVTNGITQVVQDGKLVDTSASGNTQSTSSSSSNSSLDKDAFLQLLVAQMKYQDPLEPTSNTEYISQLATFSSLEEMQNLNKTMTDMQGADLVGKQVVMKVTSSVTGITSHVSGYVDYVQRENGETYLVINGEPYNIEDLESVVDEVYLDAVSLAAAFKEAVNNLPSVRDLTLDDKEAVERVREAVNAMTSYEQSFLDEDALTTLKELVARIAELEKNIETPNETPEDAGSEEGTEGEGADETEGTDNSGGEENE